MHFLHSLLLCFLFISLCHSQRLLQILRLLSPECNNHGYYYKGKCFCQSQWTGDKCQTSKSSGWFNTDTKCDDLLVRLDNLVNISPEYYLLDDDEFPRLSGNSLGEGDAAYGEKGVTWIKMHDINPDFRIFSEDSLNNFDIHQGSLGNCYLLASFASLVNIRGGEIIKDLFETKTDNDKHVYVTRWLINGKPRYVAVDEWVPGEGNTPSFSLPTGDHDLWGVILEKAWAKIHGNYMITQGGWHTNVWHSLTQAPVFDLYHQSTTTSDFIFNHLKQLLNNEYPVGAATVNIASTHEVGGHAYSVLGAYEVRLDNGQTQKLIRMYNPWNKEVWSDNPWADTQPVWTESVKSQVPYTNSDDGQFYVTPEDYLANFGVTNWAEVRKGYEVAFQDLGIPSNQVNYAFKFKVSNNLKRDLYIFIDKPDGRLLQGCGESFSITSLNVKGSLKTYYPESYGDSVKVEAAADGEYTITFSFERRQSFLQYFTVSIYAASGTIEFLANQYTDIVNKLAKTCSNNCNNQGRCNTFNGVCTCYFGFTGSDCSQKDVKQCPNNCNGQGVCDSTFGKCSNCTAGYDGAACDPCTDKSDCQDWYVSNGYCATGSEYSSYVNSICQKSCGLAGFKEAGNCYIPKDVNPTPTPDPNPIDKCSNVNCGVNGKCDSATGACICDAYYSGSSCEYYNPPSPDPSNKCLNEYCNFNGKCDESTGYCSCDTDYYGNHCEVYIPSQTKCQNENCSYNGACEESTGRCNCFENYSGEKCEQYTPKVDCADQLSNCNDYIAYDYCQKYPEQMKYFCSLSCGFCQ